jgi:hypothetical protein
MPSPGELLAMDSAYLKSVGLVRMKGEDRRLAERITFNLRSRPNQFERTRGIWGI